MATEINARQTGRVKWFQNSYGFIERDGKGPDEKDVFVHHSRINMKGFRTLDENDRVEYTPVAGPKGMEAHDVIKLDA